MTFSVEDDFEFFCSKCKETLETCTCLKKVDMVNNPPHYKLDGLNVEALDVIEAVLTREQFIGYLIGNCLKYSMRAPKKNGEEDYKKLNYYSKVLERILNDSS